MKQINCDCPVCQNKPPNVEGIQLAEREVIPFFKQELLKLRYPCHPFPLRYEGLLASIFCFSQAILANRKYGTSFFAKYYTTNKWMLKFSVELEAKFGMPIVHQSELQTKPVLVCELNTEEIKDNVKN